MQRKLGGPGGAIIYNFEPPYRPWSDNQATYLFFPVVVCFILSLVSTLSAPIIPGLGSVKLVFQGNGTMVIGTWGWCADTIVNATCTSSAAGCANALTETVSHICSSKRPFGHGMDQMMAGLPQPLATFSAMSTAVTEPQLDAAGALHITSVVVNWLALLWTLAACGEWESQREKGWKWTRWAFAGNIASGIFTAVEWALTLATFTRYHKVVKDLGLNGIVKVQPGPSVFMLMVAFAFSLGTFLTRLLWSRKKPRPLWSMKDGAPINSVNAAYRRSLEVQGKYRVSEPGGAATIFATANQSLNSEGGDELPPTWNSLNIDTKDSLARGEKPDHGII